MQLAFRVILLGNLGPSSFRLGVASEAAQLLSGTQALGSAGPVWQQPEFADDETV